MPHGSQLAGCCFAVEGHHEHPGPLTGQPAESLGKRRVEVHGSLAGHPPGPVLGADRCDAGIAEEDVDPGIGLQGEEVAGDGADAAPAAATAHALQEHRLITLGEVEEHAGEGSFLLDLLHEPAFPGSCPCRLIDALLGQPSGELGDEVTVEVVRPPTRSAVAVAWPVRRREIGRRHDPGQRRPSRGAALRAGRHLAGRASAAGTGGEHRTTMGETSGPAWRQR